MEADVHQLEGVQETAAEEAPQMLITDDDTTKSLLISESNPDARVAEKAQNLPVEAALAVDHIPDAEPNGHSEDDAQIHANGHEGTHFTKIANKTVDSVDNDGRNVTAEIFHQESQLVPEKSESVKNDPVPIVQGDETVNANGNQQDDDEYVMIDQEEAPPELAEEYTPVEVVVFKPLTLIYRFLRKPRRLIRMVPLLLQIKMCPPRDPMTELTALCLSLTSITQI